MVTRIFRVPFACVLLLAAASAQSTKISGELAQPVGGNVTFNYQVTPDGSRVVYQADQEVDEDYEVYSVPADGSGPAVRLSGPEGDVTFSPSFELTPDGTHVGYYADVNVYFVPTDGSASPVQLDNPGPGASMGDTDPFFRFADNDWLLFWNEGEGGLWSVPTDGSAGILLSSTATYVPSDFVISPDASRVFFRSNINFTGLELFSVAIDGSGTAIPFGIAERFRMAPDGSRLVFLDDRDTTGVFELYSAPADGTGTPVKLNGVLPPGADVAGLFEITPDSSRVVFGTFETGLGLQVLYSVPIDGSTQPRRITGPFTAGGSVASMAISPDGRRVVYRADQRIDEVYELFSVPSDHYGGHFRLNGPLVADGDVFTFRISPNSRRVVYRADQNADQRFELFSASIDQDSRHRLRLVEPIPVSKLNGPLVAGGNVQTDYAFSPDGSLMIFRADAFVDEQIELFAAAVDGSNPAYRLHDPLLPYNDVYSFRMGAGRVAFQAPQDPLSPFYGTGVFGMGLDGVGSPVMLNPPMTLGPVTGDVHEYEISPDGTRTVYLADQDDESVDELYSVPTRGGATPVKLNPPLGPAGDVGFGFPSPTEGAFRISPDGAQVVFVADQVTENVRDLYRVPIDGSEPPVVLASGEDVRPGFAISPDGTWVVYRQLNALGELSLHGVRLDGSGPPVELSGSVLDASDVVSFLISPDSTRVVYLADLAIDERFELFSTPIDGSAPFVRLHLTLVGNRDVTDYAISPDGLHVVYLVDHSADEVFDCYSVPIDRSETPIRLNTIVNSGREVLAFEISSDSYHVVFVGDCSSDGVNEIYSVHIRRVSGPTKLNPTLVAGGDVGRHNGTEFAISPDARRVIYIADQEANDVYELFSVSIDGPPAPTKLNGPMHAGGTVESFEITANSRRVVFLASPPFLAARRIYSVVITGERAPFALTGDLVPGGHIRSFALDPFGFQVAYVADQETYNVRELYRVPVLGTHAPMKLNGPINGTFNQIWFRFSPRGNRVVFRGDPESPDVYELFSSRLGKMPLRAATPKAFIQR